MIARPGETDHPVTHVDLRHPSGIDTGSVPQTCLAAGAQLGERDHHVPVALYGSTPGEIAVCMSHVGLADRSDLGTLEMRGPQPALDRALSAPLGDPPIAPGSGRRRAGVWYLRLDTRRALLVAPHATLSVLKPLCDGPARADLVCHELGARIAMISVIGPRAARLLRAAAMPADLQVGAVARDPRDPSVVAILRETQRRVLIVARAPAIDAVWSRLLAAGEPLGAAFVGCDALALLDAASAQAPV
jgi:glycine cleavage system aminomethyltransferase T